MIWVVLLAAGLLGVLLASLFRLEAGRRRRDFLAEAEAPAGQPCTLCGTALKRGERVHSVLYMTKTEDKTMDIFGCPYCFKGHPAGRKGPGYDRHCPVCKSRVEDGQPVMARVFFRKDRRQHVHVLGCAKCRQKKSV